MDSRAFVMLMLSCLAMCAQAHLKNYEILANLFKTLESQPGPGVQAQDFKTIVKTWVDSTDEKSLRELFSSLQQQAARSNTGPRAPSKLPRTGGSLVAADQPREVLSIDHALLKPTVRNLRTRHTKLVAKPGQQSPHTHPEEVIPDVVVLEAIRNITSQDPTVELIHLLTALDSTPEGKAVTAKLGIPSSLIQMILNQLKSGNKNQLELARKQINTQLESLGKKDVSKLREIFEVYKLYKLRQASLLMIKKATLEELKTVLSVLSRAEKRHPFDGIKFKDLLDELVANKEGALTKVLEKLSAWINTTNSMNLMRAGQYGRVATSTPKTLDQVKAVLIDKIDRKSAAQLIEFLEVFKTAEGQSLMKKFQFKPDVSVEDLIKQLKSDSKTDVNSVKNTLKEWVRKFDLKDMQALQNSRQLFTQYRARKAAAEGVQKADLASMMKVLTYLSTKETAGAKFEGIKFTDELQKLAKNGEKSLDDVKKILLKWIETIKFEQLIALRNVYEQAVLVGERKPVNSQTGPSPLTSLPGQQSTTTTPIRSTSSSTVKQTSPSGSNIKTGRQFQEFITNSKPGLYPAATVDNVKTAVSQVVEFGTSYDINAVFHPVFSGQSRQVTRTMSEGHFQSQLLKFRPKVLKTKSIKDLIKLRTEVKDWVKGWTVEQTKYFVAWYKIGLAAEATKRI